MAKFNWGFEIDNKATHCNDGLVVIRCTRSDTSAQIAWGGDRKTGREWGDVIEHDMTPSRLHDAQCALETWGYC